MKIMIFMLYAIAFLQPQTAYAQSSSWQETQLRQPGLTDALVTTKGIFVSQNTGYTNPDNHNGVWYSDNFGSTWKKRGLGNRRVNGLYEAKDTLFAATEYSIDGVTRGIFKSVDSGNSWEHMDTLNIGITKINGDHGDILFAGSANFGLWKSADFGKAWKQVIGSGFYGPDIRSIEVSDSVVFVADDNGIFTSLDMGDTWEEHTFFKGKKISCIRLHGDSVYVGTSNLEGLYVSYNNGKDFMNISYFNGKPIGTVEVIDNLVFVSATNSLHERTVYVSFDNGKSWEDTRLQDKQSYANVTAIKSYFFGSKKLIATTHFGGTYVRDVSSIVNTDFPFLSYPIDVPENANIYKYINAYFDHAYPLLGYTYFSEPHEDANTTVNFLGMKEAPPQLYYSAHDAIDFDGNIGDPVYAAANGVATYTHCVTCGNTIKIDHGNGYQTTYMHLGNTDLITTSEPKPVKEGDLIGRIGLTGNTTGAHLHFVVTKDTNNNVLFQDDIPHGKVDPFGWQPQKNALIKQDPWATFTWSDARGTHSGTLSKYLWKTPKESFDRIETVQPEQPAVVQHRNKQLIFGPASFHTAINIVVSDYISPKVNPAGLEYVKDTSTLISAITSKEDNVQGAQKPVQIVFNLSQLTPIEKINLIGTTLKIYRYVANADYWEPIENLYYDKVLQIVAGTTTHFSQFAVFGEINREIQTVRVKGGTFSSQ